MKFPNLTLLKVFICFNSFLFFATSISAQTASQLVIVYGNSSTYGTYTFPALPNIPLQIELWGAGGRGGRKTSTGSYICAGGGGGGAYVKTETTITTSTNITVGQGGYNSSYLNGGNSSFNSISANGGKGVADANGDGGGLGSGVLTNGGSGGTATSGVTSYAGGNGGNGYNNWFISARYGGGGGSSAGTGKAGAAGGSGSSNDGGKAPEGGGDGGKGADPGGANPGTVGGYPGGGGGGAINGGTPGTGANGKVVITIKAPTVEIAQSVICAGRPAVLSIKSASSVATYQWYRNGALVSTGTTLTVANPVLGDRYTVSATYSLGSSSNYLGAVSIYNTAVGESSTTYTLAGTSSPLTVTAIPEITVQNFSIPVGNTLNLAAGIAGYSESSYISYFNDAGGNSPVSNPNSITGLAIGQYTYYASAWYQGGCSSDLKAFTVTVRATDATDDLLTLRNISACISQGTTYNVDLNEAVATTPSIAGHVDFYNTSNIQIPSTYTLNPGEIVTLYAHFVASDGSSVGAFKEFTVQAVTTPASVDFKAGLDVRDNVYDAVKAVFIQQAKGTAFDLTSVINTTSHAMDILFYNMDSGSAIEIASPETFTITSNFHQIKLEAIHLGDCNVLNYMIYITTPDFISIWQPDFLNKGTMTDDKKRNWYAPENWMYLIAPDENSTVYIPGNVDYFPYLSAAGKPYKCDIIYFMHGGEIGQPQNLTYNNAFVHWDFGLQSSTQQIASTDDELLDVLKASAKYSRGPLSRNKWHMLTAPMKDMVTGDLAFGLYPTTFLRKFDASSVETGSVLLGTWTNYFSSSIEPLGAAEGFILWVNGYQDVLKSREYGKGIDSPISSSEREYGLRQANGIFQFPFYNDEAQSTAHRNHKYENGQSIFYGINSTSLAVNNTPTAGVSRTNANRFIFDGNATITYPITAGTSGGRNVALVGNPYMTTINFDEFAADNPDIKTGYILWTEDNFSYYTSGTSSGSVTLDQYIAPMQSFLVEFKDGVNSTELTFNISDISCPRPAATNSKLRSSGSSDNVLRIEASNEAGSISTVIALREDGQDTFGNKDISKVITGVKPLPEVYTIKEHHSGRRGVANNFIADWNSIIPVGLSTNWAGEINFNFTGMDNQNVDIYFIDRETNANIDISALPEYNYNFTYAPEADAKGNILASEDRFYIQFSPSIVTDLDKGVQELIRIDCTEGNLSILSQPENNILGIAVYDMQGRLLYSDNQINASMYHVQLPAISSVCIVKLITEKCVKTRKILIK